MLYANTDDGSSALWVCDENGVVVDNISYSIADRAPILEQINEHYGTSFTGWSDNEIGLRLGDTIPYWNAYEKIEMQLQKLAVHTTVLSKYVIGYINESNEYVMYVFDSDTFPIIADNGEMSEVGNGLDGFKQYVILPTLQQSEYAINTIVTEIIPTMQVGDVVQDWNSYAKI